MSRLLLDQVVLSGIHPEDLPAADRVESTCESAVSSHKESSRDISNQRVLAITCLSFTLFFIAEIIGALASNSLSLLGDASAMGVDVFTYFTNMYAERVKSQGQELSKRAKFILEVGIPSFSVCALLGITGWITSDAINVIIEGGEDDDVDISFLYGFACANFVVDLVSTCMFYIRRKNVFSDKLSTPLLSSIDDEEGTEKYDPLVGPTDKEVETNKTPTSNLNMISAFTHVGGDTLRTISVFVAAVIATVTSVPGSVCDAWAAVVVSITIVLCVTPLIFEIYKKARAN